MRLVFLLSLLSFSFVALAQHSEQPQKESTDDLRNQNVLFSIEVTDSKKLYWLERSANLDYFLRSKSGKKEAIQKISSKDAQKMDMTFASGFLKCQYELPSAPGDCKLTLRLTMKGETQEICAKDEQKNQVINSFLQDMIKQF